MFKHKSDEEKRVAIQVGEERNRLFNEKLALERTLKREKRNSKTRATEKDSMTPEASKELLMLKKIEIQRAKADEKKRNLVVKAKAEEGKIERYGRLILKESVGTKTVRLYSKGFVSISGLFTSEKPVEKLIAVSLRSNLSKKTGIGRAAAFVATGGINLVATGNTRGDLYLSITTSKTVHLIHSDGSSSSDRKSFPKVEATALAIIDNPGAFED